MLRGIGVFFLLLKVVLGAEITVNPFQWIGSYGLEISSGGDRIRLIYEGVRGNWVDVSRGGTSVVGLPGAPGTVTLEVGKSLSSFVIRNACEYSFGSLGFITSTRQCDLNFTGANVCSSSGEVGLLRITERSVDRTRETVYSIFYQNGSVEILERTKTCWYRWWWGPRSCRYSFRQVTSRVPLRCPSCPPGYTFNPSELLCEGSPQITCTRGRYDSSLGKCVEPPVATYTCPQDPSSPCIETQNGYFCSQNSCFDANSLTITDSGSNAGENDIPNDGEVTGAGCMGTVYIFNGRDLRCIRDRVLMIDCCKTEGLNVFEQSYCRDWGYHGQEPYARNFINHRKDGKCHYIGQYCAFKVDLLGVCLLYHQTFCCFDSKLGRIIHEQGRPQIGLSWGTPEDPQCRGFTPLEFQKLDFSQMDLSEWIESEVKSKIVPGINNSLMNAVENYKKQFENIRVPGR